MDLLTVDSPEVLAVLSDIRSVDRRPSEGLTITEISATTRDGERLYKRFSRTTLSDRVENVKQVEYQTHHALRSLMTVAQMTPEEREKYKAVRATMLATMYVGAN